MNAMTAQPAMSKSIARVAAGTLALLLVPLVAMQFTREVNWTLSDFIIGGALLFATGLLLTGAARTLRTRRARMLAGAAIALGFAYVWAELAVGIFFHFGS